MGNVDGRDRHRIARKCAGTGGRCSVTGQNLSTLKPHHHAHRLILRVTTPALPLYSLALAIILTVSADSRMHPLSGMGSSLNTLEDIGMGVIDIAPIVTQSQ